ncbi:MAG: DUF3179 domain-containing (seleno)protein [Granulosicoccus sp.]
MRQIPGAFRSFKNGNKLVFSLLLPACVLLGSGVVDAQNSDGKTDEMAESEKPVVLDENTSPTASLSEHVIARFGTPPESVSGPLKEDLARALEVVFIEGPQARAWGVDQVDALNAIAESGDSRLAWLVSDLMRVAGSRELMSALAASADKLLDITIDKNNIWGDTVDHLIAWDIPAPPDYLKYKRSVYTLIVPEWEKLFTEGDIDWRHVSWGGVRIDDRAFDTTDEPCNCIPAADNPVVSSAEDADWLDDDDIVFGIEVNGEYRAYPRQIMEVREMVNDTLGGRDLGIPYCTLCGSAQAYFTDDVPEGVERPILRTSGLLIRSNKVMYDLNTYSVLDTFRGQAANGPLAEKKVVLKQAGVVTTEWGDWKAAHPQTTVLKESLALGRDFDFRNNRDANGPIFPIGDVDPRLPVQEDIVGVITDSGEAIAFHKDKAFKALQQGEQVAYANIQLALDGGGVKALDKQGNDLGGHQAFWFAWSQFYPDTKLWPM